ncbi:hypothetical protein [Umezawaea sp. Da 62-37]|uniref:hypothetical protein n=1 Tax=Umezawaea sp. Da 62-37 TaxID=3075927 RepID=UPI0028F706A8|nr:hypothetical protein [Umezawaea sp. Da 62-37]WNV92197.1 hypothetical protein RM788_44805 [Umezawaea sp. Da 62-37]
MIVAGCAAVAAWVERCVAVAVVASELNTAVPMDPPICWAAVTMAAATPVSCDRTPLVAAFCTGPKISPNPMPVTSRAGSTAPA